MDPKEVEREDKKWIYLAQNTYRQVMSSCRYSNEALGYMKAREHFELLNNYHLLKMISAPWVTWNTCLFNSFIYSL